MQFGPYSSYLQATGFGFSIPTTASICGIELNVERSFSGSIPVQDYFIHVVKNNTVTGLDYSLTYLDWDTTDLVVTYGSNSDLWGNRWTPPAGKSTTAVLVRQFLQVRAGLSHQQL
ncbi:MAG: hypothetical protein IPG01_02505 [Chitinophagaceae bacterium]|nr:hypothetical protein [Chitinophagaceae bacterium]